MEREREREQREREEKEKREKEQREKEKESEIPSYLRRRMARESKVSDNKPIGSITTKNKEERETTLSSYTNRRQRPRKLREERRSTGVAYMPIDEVWHFTVGEFS